MQKNLPNILSAIRIVLAPIFLVMYLQDESIWRSLSVAVFATAAITDFFDGYLARHYGIESKLGVFLDPLADKFLTFAGFFCLPFLSETLFPWWAIIIIVIRDVFVTVMRLYADKQNYSMETRFMAKLKTMVQMIFLYVILLMGVFADSDIGLGEWVRAFFNTNAPTYLLYFVMGITLYSGIEYILVNRKLFGKPVIEQT